MTKQIMYAMSGSQLTFVLPNTWASFHIPLSCWVLVKCCDNMFQVNYTLFRFSFLSFGSLPFSLIESPLVVWLTLLLFIVL